MNVPWWIPVLTLIAGYLLNMAADWFRDRRAANREHAEREQLRQDRRDELQRQTLLSLQDAIHRERRVLGEIDVVMQNYYKRTHDWSGAPVTGEQSQNAIDVHTETVKLGVRVFDDALRAKVLEFRNAGSKIVHAESAEAQEKALDELTELMDGMNEQIGDILRGLY